MAEFSGANDTALNALMLIIRMPSGLYDMDIHEHEIYEHAQTRFLKFRYTDTENGAQGTQCVTQHGGITYYFNFHSCTDRPDDDSKNTVNNSIVFEYDPKRCGDTKKPGASPASSLSKRSRRRPFSDYDGN